MSERESPKVVSSTVSMSSTDSRATTSTLRRPESKRPRKDVSVSFKQIPDTDEESLKMNHSEDGEQEHRGEEDGDTRVNGKLSEQNCDDDKKEEHSDENNTKL